MFLGGLEEGGKVFFFVADCCRRLPTGIIPIDFDTFQVPLYRSPERGEVNAEQIGLDAQRRSELLRSGENADSETP